MSLHKEIEQEAAKIRAYLWGKTRVYAYLDNDKIVIKDRIYCNNGLQAMGSYHKDMIDKKDEYGRDVIEVRLRFYIDALSAKGHIPSSLGKHLDVMRNSEISE